MSSEPNAVTQLVVPEQEIAKYSAEEQKLREFEQESQKIVAQLKSVAGSITDQDTYELAATTLKNGREYKKKVVEWFKPWRKIVADIKEKVTGREDALVDPVANEIKVVESAIIRFDDEMERRKKKEDLERIQAASKQEEQDRKVAAETAKALGAGPQAVEALLEDRQPLAVPPSSGPAVRRVAGGGVMKRWTYRFENSEVDTLKKIIQEVTGVNPKRFKNAQLLGYLLINESNLQSTATGQKSLAKVPGVVFFEEKKASGR